MTEAELLASNTPTHRYALTRVIGVPGVKPPAQPPHPLYLSSLLRPVIWRQSTREVSCAR